MCNKPGLLRVLRREVSRMTASRITLLLLVVFPMLWGSVLVAMFYSRSPRELPIAICDLDESPLSRQLVRMIDATPGTWVRHQVIVPQEGESMILKKTVYALAVIPADFERDLKRGSAPQVAFFTNGQLILPGSLISRDLRRAVGTLSAAADMARRRKTGEMSVAAEVHFEPVRLNIHSLFNPALDYSFFLLPSVLMCLLMLFVLFVAIHVVAIELKEGTGPEWLEAAGGSTPRALAGKLLPYLLYETLLLFVSLIFLEKMIGVPPRGSSLLLGIGTVLFVFATVSVGLFIAVWTANLRLACSLAAFYGGPAFAFAGVTFPIVSMPTTAAAWANILPVTHYLRLLTDQVARGAPAGESISELFALSVFILIGGIFSCRRASRVLRHERYWGAK